MGLDHYGDSSLPSPETQPKPVRSAAWRFILEIFQTVLLALVIYFLIDTVIARVRVENISMKPTLQPGELVIVNKLAYRFGAARYGDIIVFHYPPNPSEDYIKRVIGLPGETVKVRNGVIIVNGRQMTENYTATRPLYNGDWTVPIGSLFVLGDNRNQSSDSHDWGFVPMSNVVGKAIAIYWPFSDVRILTQSLMVNTAN